MALPVSSNLALYSYVIQEKSILASTVVSKHHLLAFSIFVWGLNYPKNNVKTKPGRAADRRIHSTSRGIMDLFDSGN